MVAQSRIEYEVSVDDNTAQGAAQVGGTLGEMFREAGEDAERVGERLEEGLEDAVDDAESGPFERLKSSGAAAALAIAASIGAAMSSVLEGINTAIDFAEERRNALELRVFTPTPAEEALHRSLGAAGFSPEEGAAGILATRAFDLDPASREASNLGLTTSALARAGINTRFLPQLAQRFGVGDDPDALIAQLGVGADVVSQEGVDFEEVFSEIADNPQVYGAFPTFAHAAQFIVSQGLAPPEVTIQLEQGFLAPRGGAVTGDPYTLTGITPTAAERFEQGQGGLIRGLIAGADAIPVVGGELAGLIRGTGTLTEYLSGPDLDRTGQRHLTLRGEAGDVIVDGMAVVTQASREIAEALDRFGSRADAYLQARGEQGYRQYLQDRAVAAGEGHPGGTN